MKRLMVALLFLAGLTGAFADCTDLIDGSVITESTTLCSDTYDIISGITITGSDLVFDCKTAVLRGQMGTSEIGITLVNATGVTIKNCNLVTFNQALFMKNVTHSIIEENGFLKGRIGVRMLDSYENILRDNLDKSREVPISAISSKFNVVHLNNRNVDRNFCAVNSCNEDRLMDVCVDDDFYCSDACDGGSDSDCKPASERFEPVVDESLPAITGKTIADFRKEVEEEFEGKEAPKPEVRSGIPASFKYVIYGGVPLMLLLAVIIVRRSKE